MNVIFAADYIAQSPGAFINSLLALSKRISIAGGKVGFLFSEKRDYHNYLKREGPIQICKNTTNRRFSWVAINQTVRMCKLINADIIHIHFVGMSYLLSACIAKILFRSKIVVHWRNPPISVLQGARFIHHFSALFYRFLNYMFININITISQSIADTLVQRKYALSHKVAVLHNGIDLNGYHPSNRPDYILIENKFKIDIRSRSVIGMVANFSRQKDQMTLVKAVEIVKRDFPDILLLLVGSEKLIEGRGYLDSVKSYIMSTSLEKNVVFAGEWQNVADIIKCFDIGVLLSNFEGFGNAVVEYMAMQKPVIGTNVGGISEIIINGETGFLVSPRNPHETAERILQLLKNPVLKKKMGQRGRKVVEKKFTTARWVNDLCRIYQSIMKSDRLGG